MARFGGSQSIDKSDYIWLAYLLFFFLEPISRHSGIYWLESIGILVLFLALYFAFLRAAAARTRQMMILGLALLGVAVMPFNDGGGACFLIYSVSLLPYAIASLPWAMTFIALDLGVMVLSELHIHFSHSAIFSTVFFGMVSAAANIIFAQKERANCKLRMKQEEVEALAAVAERERIARDLHDVLGHTLSLIVLKAELAGRLLDAGTPAAATRARAELADVESTARTALAEVREAIGGYRARGLGAEIEAARRTLDAAGVTLLTEASPTQGLTAAEETVLALALREAVTNIVRHARATECRVRFVSERGRHRLAVEDNGENAVEREGNGLRGMRERVESLGGTLQLAREQGTRLLIEIPTQLAVQTPEPLAS